MTKDFIFGLLIGFPSGMLFLYIFFNNFWIKLARNLQYNHLLNYENLIKVSDESYQKFVNRFLNEIYKDEEGE